MQEIYLPILGHSLLSKIKSQNHQSCESIGHHEQSATEERKEDNILRMSGEEKHGVWMWYGWWAEVRSLKQLKRDET